METNKTKNWYFKMMSMLDKLNQSNEEKDGDDTN